MDADQKKRIVLDAILAVADITPSGSMLSLHPFLDVQGLEIRDIVRILEKFANDEKIIKIVTTPWLDIPDYEQGEPPENPVICYDFFILPAFVPYYEILNAKSATLLPTITSATTAEESAPVLWITYSEHTRKILLNGQKLLAKPGLNGNNELIFSYLYANPNRLISRKELEEKATKEPFDKRFHYVIRELGFKDDLAKIFFAISNEYISFRNPITQQQLKYDQINPVHLLHSISQFV